MEVKGSDLQREITHFRYKYKNKIKLGSEKDGWLPKVIDEPFDPIKENDYPHVTDEYLTMETGERMAIYIGGGITLTLFVLFTIDWIQHGFWGWFALLLYLFFLGYSVFSIIAYFTLPPKEIIINRKDGLITFPGWYWIDNVTMRFADIKFGYTSGGPNLIGGYILQILRPDRIGTFEKFPLGCGNCYIDLSFLTWYMDKNRPLPPGKAFDPYRERDFQRRKKEKFPPPLYPASIPTPEATPAQQKEREKFWRG